MKRRLGIVCTHPIQYYAPWFRHIQDDGRVEVTVFYLFEPGSEGFHDPFFGRTIRWDVPLLEGYRHEFVPNVSARPGPGSFWGFRNPQLANRVSGFNPDAVLLIGYNFWSLMRFIFTRPRPAPLILRGDSHRLVPSRSLREIVKAPIIAAIFRQFAAFLFVGEANRRYFQAHGVEDRQLFHAPHAVDNARFAAHADEARRDAAEWRRELGIPPDRFVFLFAGKFEAKKCPLQLIEAFKALPTGNATLLLVGDGPLEAAVREAARGRDDIVIQPFQNQALMPRTYCACDIFVLPSFGPYETWGLAVNEAMCMGKPAIVSSHVGCAEDLVESGVTGLVFEAGSTRGLSEALASALGDRKRVAYWGAAARERVSAFSYASATEGLIEAMTYVSQGHITP